MFNLYVFNNGKGQKPYGRIDMQSSGGIAMCHRGPDPKRQKETS